MTKKGTLAAPFTDQEWQDLRLATELAAGYYKGELKQHFLEQCDFGGPRHEQMDLLALKVNACWQRSFSLTDGDERTVTFTNEEEE